MTRTVSITTGARLHFGPLSHRPSMGRHFGGVGLMIEEPGCSLVLAEAACDDVTGDPAIADRVRAFTARLHDQMGPDRQPTAHRIDVLRSIPSHSGLGSGTQLGLAIARGFAEIAGERGVSVVSLAARAGRGYRSAVGLYGFERGGLIVDAGKRAGEDVGALACHVEFPSPWRALLVTPPSGRPGLSGGCEEQAFEQLGSMPDALTDRLCRIVLTDLLPAVQSGDFAAFSEAVFDYGSRVGEFFEPVQGGTFGDARTDELVRRLTRLGVRGVGQTSWGPTLFAFVSSAEQGRELAGRLAADRSEPLESCSVRMVAPLNRGAAVTVSAHD